MYRFLLQGKWVALTLLLVVLVPLSGVAADWQYHRWQSRKATNSTVATNSALPVVPLSSVLTPGQSVDGSTEWRRVNVTGHYIPTSTLLLRRQVVNSVAGFVVVSPLITDDGHSVVIERGFIPLPDSGTAIAAPPPPSGAVQVVGRVRPAPVVDAEVHPSDLPADQVNRVDVAAITTATGKPGYGLVLEAIASEPVDSSTLTPLPIPPLDEGPHLSYVGQWILIGIASIVIWIIMVRREAAHLRDERTAQQLVTN